MKFQAAMGFFFAALVQGSWESTRLLQPYGKSYMPQCPDHPDLLATFPILSENPNATRGIPTWDRRPAHNEVFF